MCQKSHLRGYIYILAFLVKVVELDILKSGQGGNKCGFPEIFRMLEDKDGFKGLEEVNLNII